MVSIRAATEADVECVFELIHAIAETLMLAAKAHCEQRGISRIKWNVQTDNMGARRFYERLGADYYEKGVFAWDLTE